MQSLLQVLLLIALLPVSLQEQEISSSREDHNLNMSLLIAVPLTKQQVKVPDPGWVQLASALMAIDHFNTRNATVVPELAQMGDCNVQFGNLSVLDTGTSEHISMTDFQSIPDAIAGPYNEIPAFELSVFATSLQIPVVSHRAVDPSLLDPKKHPYFSQVNADPFAEMEFVGSYLNHTGRTNYIAIVYASEASVMQKVDILRAILDQGMVDRQVRTFSYHSILDKTTGHGHGHDDSIEYALARVKETGFRTIILLAEDLRADAPEIQQAAAKFELNLGQHLWVLSGGAAELSSAEQVELLNTSVAAYGDENIFKGAAYLIAYDSFDFDYLNAFQSSLVTQNKTFLQRLDSLTPKDYFNWSYAADSEFVLDTVVERLISWWQGTSYLYDATISIGIGACQALANGTISSTDSVISGEELLRGIRSVDFTGASGRMVFKGGSGTRVGKTIPMTVINLLPAGVEDHELVMVSEIRDPTTGEFMQLEPFVYADGSNQPPALLRDVPEQNYLDCRIRAAGLALMGVALFVVFFSAVWVYLHRLHSVVIAAQPIYLYALCLGSAVISLNIYFISPDESMGWTEEMLDKSCVAAVWVNAIGMLLVYGSIFIKHWRVNRLMMQKNKHISIGLIVAPLTLIVATIIILQALWTSADAYGWERVEIDEISGESIGQCTGNVAPCLYLTGFFLFVPVALAGAFAYKTLGVDDLYSESRWVLIFILVQFQVYLVGAPTLQILRSVSTDGKFIGEVLLIWTVPMSTMGLIIFPKIWLVRRMQQMADGKASEGSDLQSQSSSERTVDGINPDTASPTASALTLDGPRIQIVTFD